MEQYIDKTTVIAEIESYISNYKDIVAKTDRNDSTWVDSVSMIDAKIGVLQHLLSFLNTLDVKEVDCEREIGMYTTKELLRKRNKATNVFHLTQGDIDRIAEHFFELGLKTKNNNESIHRH